MRSIVSTLALFAIVAVFITAIAQAASVVYLSDQHFKPAGLKGNPSGGYYDGIRVNSHETIITNSGSQANQWDRPTQISGQEYDKSLLFHVVKDETVTATWSLDHNFTKLTAMIGLDDTQDIPGIYPLVTVNFIGDGNARRDPIGVWETESDAERRYRRNRCQLTNGRDHLQRHRRRHQS